MISCQFFASNKKHKQEIEMTTYHHGVAGLGGMNIYTEIQIRRNEHIHRNTN